MKNSYVTISVPGEFIWDQNLTPTERNIYMAVAASSHIIWCATSEGYISRLVGCKLSVVSVAIKKLTELGYLTNTVAINLEERGTHHAV